MRARIALRAPAPKVCGTCGICGEPLFGKGVGWICKNGHECVDIPCRVCRGTRMLRTYTRDNDFIEEDCPACGGKP